MFEWVLPFAFESALSFPSHDPYGILGREDLHERCDYGVADTSIFDEDGGPSIAERFRNRGIVWQRADKRRVPGWEAMRSLLKGEDGIPRMYYFKTCTAIARDLPSLCHSEKKPEDCESEGVSDHSCFHGGVLVNTEFGQVPIKDLVGTTGKVYTSEG